MATTLRVYDRAGNRLDLRGIPWSELSNTIVRNGPGAITASVPASLAGTTLLADERFLRIAVDGVESTDYYVLDDDGDDLGDDGGEARDIAIGGQGALSVLDWVRVFPVTHTPGKPLAGLSPQFPFGDSTPGRIVGDLLTRGQARGAVPFVTRSFTDTHDSAGTPWPDVYSRIYELGDTVLGVLTQMAEDGWVDFEMTGFRLDVYVPDTVLAADRPDVVLRMGRDVTSAPRKRTRREMRSVLVSAGAEGAIVESVDAAALARFGRREGYEGRSGVTDIGTLTAVNETSLARQTSASEAFTLAMAATATEVALPRPGCYVRFDRRRLTPTELEPMRIQSIAWQHGDDATVSVELADLWVNRSIRAEKRIDALLGGSSANERVPLPGVGDEALPPAPVQGFTLVSSAYLDRTGVTAAQVTATWLEVLANSDGTVIKDLTGYEVEWQQPAVRPATETIQVGVRTSTSWSPVVPAEVLRARIRAFDRLRNVSPWSSWQSIVTGDDVTPPPPPATAGVGNYTGLLRVMVSFTDAGGLPLPPDTAEVQVHVSTVADFAPEVGEASTTFVGAVTAPGPVFTRTPYGQVTWVKLVAVDRTGNVSQPSVAASGSTTQLVGTDLGGNVVSLDNVTFRDEGNLVDDGSFAAPALVATRLAGNPRWTSLPAEDGTAFLRRSAGGPIASNRVYLGRRLPVRAAEQLMARMRVRSDGADGSFLLNYVVRSTDGTEFQYQATTAAPVGTTPWTWTVPLYFDLPADASTVDLFLAGSAHTVGTWDVDQVEVRKVVGTLLVQDAAIARAKIGLLAVGTAQVEELSAARLTAGIVTADVTIAGRFASSLDTTVQRTEQNALGFYGWNGTSSTPTLQLDGKNNVLTGLIQTAQTGRRVVMGGTGAAGQLSFMAPDGRFGRLVSFTEGTGLEATRMEMSSGSYMNMNTDNYTSYRARVHEFQVVSSLAGTSTSPTFRVFTDAFLRFYIDQNETKHVTPNGYQTYAVNGNIDFAFGASNKGGSLEFRSGGGNVSPILRLFGGTGFGTGIRVTASAAVQEVEIVNPDATAYASMRAAAFNVASDGVTKRSIRSVEPADMLADVLNTRVRRYRRKARGKDAPEEIGLVAQEAPGRIVGPDQGLGRTVDLYQMGSLTWGAVQELHRMLSDTRADLGALRERIDA